MGVYYREYAKTPDIKTGGGITWFGFYARSVNCNFLSNRKRPDPLTPTGGTLQVTFRNTARVSSYPSSSPYESNKPCVFSLPSTASTVSDGGSDAGLLNRALSGLSGQSLNLAITLGEMPETIEMLAKAADAAARAFKAFRKGDILGGFKALGQERNLSRRQRAKLNPRNGEPTNRTPESSYLEATFGWQPFFSDINSALKLADNNFLKGRRISRVASNGINVRENKRRMEGFQLDGEGVPDEQLPGPGGGTWLSLQGTISNPNAVLLQSLLGNPASNLYELIPGSFILDYFIDVGNFLQALTGTVGFSSVIACKTVQRVTKTTSTSPYCRGAEASRTITSVRTVVILPSVPRWPAMVSAGVTTSQATNISAILAQRLRAK